jgi:hypothetical protein
LRARIADGTLPPLDADNQNLYLVIMPQGVSNQNSGFVGEHTYYVDPAGRNVHFGWITNGGTLNGVTSILSHELVESVTDPEGSVITGVAGTCIAPTTPGPGGPEVKSRVKVERASGAYITYWIEVTNLTNRQVDIEGRYVILDR